MYMYQEYLYLPEGYFVGLVDGETSNTELLNRRGNEFGCPMYDNGKRKFYFSQRNWTDVMKGKNYFNVYDVENQNNITDIKS